jgi:hypothetical protein
MPVQRATGRSPHAQLGAVPVGSSPRTSWSRQVNDPLHGAEAIHPTSIRLVGQQASRESRAECRPTRWAGTRAVDTVSSSLWCCGSRCSPRSTCTRTCTPCREWIGWRSRSCTVRRSFSPPFGGFGVGQAGRATIGGRVVPANWRELVSTSVMSTERRPEEQPGVPARAAALAHLDELPNLLQAQPEGLRHRRASGDAPARSASVDSAKRDMAPP